MLADSNDQYQCMVEMSIIGKNKYQTILISGGSVEPLESGDRLSNVGQHFEESLLSEGGSLISSEPVVVLTCHGAAR